MSGTICNHNQDDQVEIVGDIGDHKTNNKFSIVQCARCGLIITNPCVDSASLKKYYVNYRHKDNGKRFWLPIENLLNFWHIRRAANINKIKPTGKILDIGCGRGIELEKLRKFHWDPYGTEYFSVSKSQLEQKGIKIFIGDVWRAGYPADFFDVVTMWHSLEHMRDPAKVIAETKRILKKGGILKIAVPNFDSWERKLTQKDWFHLDIPRHLYHFSLSSLSFILKKNGLLITDVRYVAPEYDFYSFWQSLLNKLPLIRYNHLYHTIQGEEQLTWVFVIELLYEIPFLAVFIIVSVFFVPLSWIFKKSGTIELTAAKV